MIFDTAPATGMRTTADGYLVADVRVARVGVQDYNAAELGLAETRGVVRAYRPEEQVFDAASLRSFAHRPVTIEHPRTAVTADNWRTVAVGQTGGEVVRDGEYVRVPLLLMDAQAIAEVQAGRRELSMGYVAEVVDSAGVAPDGTPYDVVLRNLRMNHLAVVQKARGGEQLRIGDGAEDRGAAPRNRKGSQMTTKTVVLGDAALTLPVADAAKIEAFKADMTRRLADAESYGKKMKDEKEELEDEKEELEDEKNKYKEMADAALDPVKLSALVADRARLEGHARTLAPELVVDGLANDEIRRQVVVARLGDAAIEGVSAEVVDGMFRALIATAPNDTVRSALRDSAPVAVNDGWGRAAKAAGVKFKKEA